MEPSKALYPALHRLEKRGWLAAEWGESENGRQAKFYKLSAKGRKQLASEDSPRELVIALCRSAAAAVVGAGHRRDH